MKFSAHVCRAAHNRTSWLSESATSGMFPLIHVADIVLLPSLLHMCVLQSNFYEIEANEFGVVMLLSCKTEDNMSVFIQSCQFKKNHPSIYS